MLERRCVFRCEGDDTSNPIEVNRCTRTEPHGQPYSDGAKGHRRYAGMSCLGNGLQIATFEGVEQSRASKNPDGLVRGHIETQGHQPYEKRHDENRGADPLCLASLSARGLALHPAPYSSRRIV